MRGFFSCGGLGGGMMRGWGKFGEDVAGVVLDEGSIAGRAGVAAGSAVAVGVDPVRGGLRGFGEEGRH